MPEAGHSRAPRWAFALVGLALAGVLALAVISFLDFNGEANSRTESWTSGNPELGDGVLVVAHALTVDPAINEATFRLDFEPKGSYVDPENRLTQPVRIEVLTSTGTVTKAFAAGHEMRSQDIKESLFDGFQGDYPFDHYVTEINTLLINGSDNTVPSALDVVASVHGFSFSLRNNKLESDESRTLALNVRRSSATRLFAIFVMVMLWALALTAVGLMVRVILLGRRIQFPMFAFLAAMLFAFPAVRNALPGAPPLGVRLDYLSFFWAEMLVAFSLVVMVGVWVIRHATDDP